MKQCLSLILILTAFTITSEAQKPNTKHCYKLETETDLFDDGSRLEFPESTHSSSATAYGWSHMGTARLSRDELQQFVEKGVRAIKIGRYDQEINGNAGKSVWMTSAYCVANHR
ncbi:hypothetical protein N9C70_03115 [Flavobacteriales bacterium]|nr:hypothetical protein [Flavobacteriales bacterium]